MNLLEFKNWFNGFADKKCEINFGMTFIGSRPHIIAPNIFLPKEGLSLDRNRKTMVTLAEDAEIEIDEALQIILIDKIIAIKYELKWD